MTITVTAFEHSPDGGKGLATYVARGEARPAYKRVFDAQLAVYAGQPKVG
jgi:hypothetical protein